MNNIVNWEYYCSLCYEQKVTEENFDAAERKAEAVVRSVIGFIRWNQITEETFGFEVLKETICQTINLLTDNEASGIGKGISSVSNDGYSESYAATSASEVDESVKASIRSMLSGTGLVGAY